MKDPLDSPFRFWLGRHITNIGHRIMIGSPDPVKLDERMARIKAEMDEYTRKEAARCADEIALKNQVQRYKARMIVMRGWVLASGIRNKDDLNGWFDPDGEPL